MVNRPVWQAVAADRDRVYFRLSHRAAWLDNNGPPLNFGMFRTCPDSIAGNGQSLMDDEVRFAVSLLRGTAEYYDRYRLPYPEAMVGDLARRAQVPGRGRLLDLACGTGQLAF